MCCSPLEGQRGRYDLTTEQQQKWVGLVIMSLIQTDYLWVSQKKLLLSHMRARVGMGSCRYAAILCDMI